MDLEAKNNFIQVKVEVAFCSLKQKLLYSLKEHPPVNGNKRGLVALKADMGGHSEDVPSTSEANIISQDIQK